MAQNRIRPIMGPSEEHLRGTTLGSGQHWIPILHFVLPHDGLQSLRAKLIHGIRNPCGVMISFWGNVLWSMANQFKWDKQVGLFEIYINFPAPISAILVGMSLRRVP